MKTFLRSKGLNLAAVLICLLSLALPAKATHIVGGDIRVDSVGIDSVRVTLTLFRDCNGITLSQISAPVTFTPTDLTCNGGQPFNVTLPWLNTVEVSQLCPAQITNSSCNNGILPGIQQFTYEAVIWLGNTNLTATAGCNDWEITWSSCCRNNANTNLVNPGGQGTVIKATINNADFPGNNTPVFTAQPIPYVCLLQTVFYNFGVVEPDGDSLSFALVAALDDPPPGTPIAYNAPYTAAQPITGIQLDPLTGQLTFTPTVTGFFTIVLQVTEFEQGTGIQKSQVFRDIQVITQNCTGVPPAGSPISNFTGSGTQSDSNSAAVCVGQDFTFDIVFSDADVNDILSVSSNITAILPGSVFNTTGTNPITATVSWTGAPVNGGTFFNFNFFVTDDACPQNNIAFFSYDVTLTPALDLGPDRNTCVDDTLFLSANVGDSFTWTVISGPPLQVGVNIGCDTCQSTWVLPQDTTTYVVNNGLDTACLSTDTLTLNVFQFFDVDIAQIPPRCVTDLPVTLTAATPGGIWTGIGVDDTTGVFDPNQLNTPLGDVDTVQVIYDLMGNCPNMDTAFFIVHGQPNTTITSTNPFCVEDTVQLTTQVPGGTWGGGPFVDPNTGEFFATQVNAPDTVLMTYTIVDSFCTRTDSLFADVIDLRNSMIDSLPKICVGGTSVVLLDSFHFEAGGTWMGDSVNTVNNTFDPTGLPAGTYNIQYSFFGSCGSLTMDSIVINDLPDVEILSMDTTYCDNEMDSVMLQSMVTNGVWGGNAVFSGNGYFIPSQLGPGTYNVTHQLFDPQTLCFNADTVDIVVNATPPVPTILTSTVCSGDSITLFASGLLSNTYTWYDESDLDSAMVYGVGNPFFFGAIAQSTWFYLTQTSAEGCESDVDSALVNVLATPTSSFTATPLSGDAPLDVDFTNTSSPGGLSYFWEFGDGNTSSQTSPSNIYANLGVYTASLTASNGICSNKSSVIIEVEGNPFIEVPNVFTPNGDGINDVFQPIVEDIESYRFVIYNRWGRKVFDTEDPEAAWDGGDQNDGTYYYVITGVTRTLNGRDVTRTGDVTLLRQGK